MATVEKVETRITSIFTREGLVIKAEVKRGWFWFSLKSVLVVGSRDENTAVEMCKQAIDRYLASGVHNAIKYPANQ